MKKHLYLPLFILLSVILAGCQSSPQTQLEATYQALNQQLTALSIQLTQQAIQPAGATQEPLIKQTDIIVSTEAPAAPANLPSSVQPTVINSALIYSGSGTLTPWTNKTLYPNALFGAANVHMICDPSGSANGKMYIDKETMVATCGAKGEGWSPWKQDLTIGDHYIYSTNANDTYEFWTVGSTPFTIRNKFSHSDFIFSVNDPGIYTLSANLIKGVFDVYLTCQEAQNFNYKITQSTSIPIVMNPAMCMITIRDAEQAPTSHAEIEVSMEFTR